MHNSLAEFYKGKRVLITGNTGFKGSWLSLVLFHFGAKVIGYSQKGNPDNSFSKGVISQTGLVQEYGDITDKNLLEKCIHGHKPDLVFHLAAQPLVSRSYEQPFETFNSNVMGTLTLLEVMRNYSGVCSLVLITSDKCYKIEKDKKEYSETDALGGFDPYSLSKAMQEQLATSYYENYFSKPDSKISCCTIRSGNVIGGGDFSVSRLIPDLVNAIQAKEKVILRNPLAVRPWIYIIDSLQAYLLAGRAISEKVELSGQSFNVGPDRSELMNVADMVTLFVKEYAASSNVVVEQQQQAQYKESEYLFLSTNKIKEVLKWKASYSTSESVRKTANWYIRYQTQAQNCISFSLKEIENYFS